MARLFVISGGPCSGKTSLVKYLESKGFFVVHESARKLVEEGIISLEDFKSKQKRDHIQRIIFKKQLEAEESILHEGIVFLDRSVVDGIAYYWIANLEPPREILSVASKRNYEKVFILEQLPFYEEDGIRHENIEEAKKIQELIIRAYTMLGYKIKFVPVMPLEERAVFVLKEVENSVKE